MKKRIGLVTVLFNSTDVLPGFFQSLSLQTLDDYWLYIIDNSLDNFSYKAAQAEIEKYSLNNVTLIKNVDNIGVAAANNQGIKLGIEAGCEYILILNNDIEFNDASLFQNMMSIAERNNEMLITPKMYFHDNGLIWCAGGEISKLRGTVRHFGEMQKDLPENSITDYTEYAPTCFMLVHRKVFEKIGMMDEKYFVYYDDVDFIWRANEAGYKLLYWAEGKIFHKVSSSTGGDDSPFSIFYSNRNRLYFIRKNYSPIFKIISLTYTLTTRFIKYIKYSKTNKGLNFKKAMLAGLKMPIDK
ncbi:glycosyltransferase family 2 protein [Janthinobacterium sp.]|uniref:glycosyltransferase family 2 protein n=1 Tax=Janthinobacterium sp. TaxID=1871054 RepID=UPI002898242F|nr:glycosyltransferase family 2 protein [Janthinobacterium sp.]